MDLKQAAEAQFEGADIAALRAYCDELGVEYEKTHNSVTLRKKLQSHLGEYQEEYRGDDEGDDEGSSTLLKALALPNLQLKSQGRWDGRRRIIQLHRAMEYESVYPHFFAWGALHCYIPFGVTAPIPYPIYKALDDAKGERIVRKRKLDDDGRIYFQEVRLPTQRFMWTDMGDDPATAHLPIDLRDMIRMLHHESSGFQGFEKRQFVELCRRLRVSVKPTWNATDMKAAIIQNCQIGIVAPTIVRDVAQPEALAG